MSSITASLYLYAPDTSSEVDLSGIFAWYGSGRKGQNGGYHAEYRVCNDEYHADSIDHRDIIEPKDNGDGTQAVAYWPDELHYPAKLGVHIDPLRRIEWTYTPEIASARARHASRAEVETAGKTRTYDNESLSIRIDIDPTAPHGIALDIG